jgi:hypothetical protein
MNKKQQDECEPYYFVGLVVRGTEKQYASLLKYLGSRNGAQVIYQCKSLTYLRVTRDDTKLHAAPVAKLAVTPPMEQLGGEEQ